MFRKVGFGKEEERITIVPLRFRPDPTVGSRDIVILISTVDLVVSTKEELHIAPRGAFLLRVL